MRDIDEMSVDLTDAYRFARLDGDGLDVCQLVFFELAAQKCERDVGAVDRHFELREEIGHAADVVLVRVREQQSAHFSLALEKVGDLIDDQIHAEHLFFGKLHAGVHDENVVSGLVHGHVAADLAAAA